MVTRKRLSVMLTLALATMPLAVAIVETLPTPVFQGKTITVAKNGAQQPVSISVQSWGLSRENHATQEIPLRGFYVAHLISGHISETIEGQTTEHLPGDYWTVKDSATLQVNILGQSAVLETIVTSK